MNPKLTAPVDERIADEAARTAFEPVAPPITPETSVNLKLTTDDQGHVDGGRITIHKTF